ncbi:MAG: hypothetical protein IJW86_03415 [Clostridia bacterium]|nr:hypothetical protein [Clostridia bacterium]
MKKLLSIILAVLMIATSIPFAFAAESDSTKTTLDVSKGNIVIADTYVTQNGEHVELDPDGYIITGKSENVDTVLEFINESSNTVTFNVVFDNLYIQAAAYCTALRIKGEGPIILNIELVGTNNIKKGSHAAFSNQGNSTLVVNLSTGSDSSNTFQSSGRFYDKDNTIVYLDGKEMDSYGHVHSGGTQACGGYVCEDCGNWYGEGTGEHTGGTQTCKGYMCETCYNWYGEADETKHGWYYGYCEYCKSEYPEDSECTHNWGSNGECKICGVECEHPSFENGSCTVCTYANFPFSLTTGETVTYHNSFADAVDKAENGSTIKLLKDHFDYEIVDIEKEITLDLNGHKWNQPSSGKHSVRANVKFTDSVGGGYCYYGLDLYSKCTFSGGGYRNISIDFETEDTLDDYLADGCNYYDYESGELLDLSEETFYEGIKIVSTHTHTGGTATCTEKAVCNGCGESYGEVDKDNHDTVDVPAKAKTCTEAGWDAYEYCKDCTYTTKVEIPASGHTEETVKGYAATCTETGLSDGVKCSECGDTLTEQVEIPASGHTKETVKGYDATCTETGLSDGVKCSACGDTLTEQTVISAKGHADANGDGVCDNGGEAIEKQEPDTPDEPSDEPTDDTTNDCDHLCHSTSKFVQFFWKIISFLQKLFGIQQYCDCGITHW